MTEIFRHIEVKDAETHAAILSGYYARHLVTMLGICVPQQSDMCICTPE